MNVLYSPRPFALAFGLWSILALWPRASYAQAPPCCDEPLRPVYILHAGVTAESVPQEPAAPSWIFSRGPYTHDPVSGARVAQYMPIPPVEPLDDQRLVTSRYRRSRTNLRGADGSVDTYYEVQQWGNGRGGLDAEWERFHDAWKESYLSGGYYNQSPYSYGSPYGGLGYGGGYGLPMYGFPGYGFPGYGFPGYGYPNGHGPGGPPHGGQGHGGHHD
jgi:hypothetical protein